MSELVVVEQVGAVAVLGMNVPRKRNALDLPMAGALGDALIRLQEDRSVRAVVLTGGAHFCAGGDLSALDQTPLEMRRTMQYSHRIVKAIVSGPAPVIAAVEGNAFGAGLSVAMACDFVVADENAVFCAAFSRFGLVPDYGLCWTLPQRAGIGAAREIMMLGESIPASRARELRLVDRLCAAGTVRGFAFELAQRLAKAPPGTLATTKAFLARAPLTLEAMLAWEADTQALLTQSADVREGIAAFMGKRAPEFTGA